MRKSDFAWLREIIFTARGEEEKSAEECRRGRGVLLLPATVL